MAIKEAKKLYDYLKEIDELGPDMTGKWAKDKAKFLKQYQEDQEMINGSGRIFQDDEFDDWSED
jgi:hypothetical protein